MAALAAQAGLAHPTILRIEAGNSGNLDSFRGVAGAFGITVSDLIGETKTPDSAFVTELRSLERRLDARGKETVLALARAQADIKPAELPAASRRAIRSAEDQAVRMNENDERAARPATKPAAKPTRRNEGRAR